MRMDKMDERKELIKKALELIIQLTPDQLEAALAKAFKDNKNEDTSKASA